MYSITFYAVLKEHLPSFEINTVIIIIQSLHYTWGRQEEEVTVVSTEQPYPQLPVSKNKCRKRKKWFLSGGLVKYRKFLNAQARMIPP